MTRLMIALYLGAAVAANLAVAQFGQAALVVTALVLIPFELVTRDILHERWTGSRLALRMALLIVAGSVVTALASPGATRIAIASTLAFAAAGTVNALVYHLCDRRGMGRYARMNVSNAAAAVADSLVFPFVAFADPSLALCAAQAATKFAGGLAWSALFIRLVGER